MKRLQKTFTVTSDGYTANGGAHCFAEGNDIEVHGMLTGETAEIDTMRKKNKVNGTISRIITASPSRIMPEELHYLSCSPWQVMEYPAQIAAKHEILTNLFHGLNVPRAEFTTADKFWGYRTKVEFSFSDRDQLGNDAPLALAFNARNSGGKQRLRLHDAISADEKGGCALLSDNVNHVAIAICTKVRSLGFASRDMKAIILRESKSTGEIIATLYAKADEVPEFNVNDIPHLAGFHVWHSTHKSPASVPTRHLWSVGKSTLTEKVGDVELEYPWDGFFQNNIPVFGKALARMQQFLTAEKIMGRDVLELYSGVGTIGLNLAKVAPHVHGVDINASSIVTATDNAERNNIANYTTECLPDNKIDADLIARFPILVLDPPRAGLHPKLVENILAAPPETIIYLSCNPETQARDWKLFATDYEMVHLEGFDFYPQTPHLESLIVLKRR